MYFLQRVLGKPTASAVGWIARFDCGKTNCHFFIVYIMYMDNIYRHINATVSSINYHFVFCPRYRRKIFLIPGVEKRFKELVKLKCEELDIEIIAMECNVDHVHLFLNCLPTQCPSDIMFRLKGSIGNALRAEIPQLSKMPNVWTRSYFVSTAGNISSETIQKYVESQRKRT